MTRLEVGCPTCRHFDAARLRCPAFPNGIPIGILGGNHAHVVPWPKQAGKTVWEPKPGSPSLADIDIENGENLQEFLWSPEQFRWYGEDEFGAVYVQVGEERGTPLLVRLGSSRAFAKPVFEQMGRIRIEPYPVR
ncbi:MAG: hypothetical protein NZL92_11695 [Gloeomargarita sp. SKYG116]|nr:hypothetical protein [Gloeomargarita sp. SKYG116]MDW8402345.1 hypothetical protein [Gloeomargarita sp. SKYGB_i_bin116]